MSQLLRQRKEDPACSLIVVGGNICQSLILGKRTGWRENNFSPANSENMISFSIQSVLFHSLYWLYLRTCHSPECPLKFPGTPPARCQPYPPVVSPRGPHLRKETYMRTPSRATGCSENFRPFHAQFLQFGWRSGNIEITFQAANLGRKTET